MKKPLIALLVLVVSPAIPLAAQQHLQTVGAYNLAEELFSFFTSDLSKVVRGNWNSEDLLSAGTWIEGTEITGEELDRAGVYWKFYPLPELSIFAEDDTPINDPVIVVESYETLVQVFYQGEQLFSLGNPVPNKIGYQYYFLENYRPGEHLFFRVVSNPYAGEEIYLTDAMSIERDIGRFSLLYLFEDFPSFVFAIFTIIVGLGMFVLFIIRFSKGEWFLLWFGIFSLSYAVFSLFETNVVNVLFSVRPIVDFYLPLLAKDLVPISLLFFYLSFLGDSWRKFLLILPIGQAVVLGLHLLIMITGQFSEWSDLLSLIFPLIMFVSISSHMIIKQRKNRYVFFFSLAFLVLGATYLIQLAGELFDLFANLPLLIGPMLFYLILSSLPVYSYFRQERLIKEQNLAFARFVPREFLQFLEKEEITQIELGDQVEREITILFADIRSFTTISEKMTPDENFAYLNRFLGHIGPIIRENGGFIDKYIGDGIMALFPSRPDDALHAAMSMLVKVEEINADSDRDKKPSIKIGIGIHKGKTMLGIVGEEERYQGTVISDAVNLASRLEALSKSTGYSVIISEATALDLQDDFALRLLGSAKVKGKVNKTKVYTLRSGLGSQRLNA